MIRHLSKILVPLLIVADLVVVRTSAASVSRTDSESYQQQQHYVPKQQLRYIPSSTFYPNEEWVSIRPDIEFLLPSNMRNRDDGRTNEKEYEQQQEQIAAATKQFLSYSTRYLEEGAADVEEEDTSTSNVKREDNAQYRVQPFVEGVSDYDAYQQAWRMLGFMIDCNTVTAYDSANQNNNNNNNNNNNHNNDKNNNNNNSGGCTRYVLWAAYVDLGYEGGGIGEYQFWDPSTNSWDTSTCDYVKRTNGGTAKRCAKMDCHLKSTHWSLLGFFKHKEIDEWMGQLFKHEGICVWTDTQYSFMKNARKAWPEACTSSGTTTSSGDYIYYDIKPKHGGGITLGLYTDAKCVVEYKSTDKNDPITLENVVGNFLVNNGGDSHDKNENSNVVNYETLSDATAAWDEAFSVWMQCQPCVAYDRHNYGYNVNDDNYRGSSYDTYRYGYDDDYQWKYYYSSKFGGNDFDCYDDADYTNVNQCMKFMAKTTMNTATFRDLAVATAQGTLVDQPLAGYYAARTSFGLSTLGTYIFFIMSIVILIYGILKFRAAHKQSSKEASSSKSTWNPKEPLVMA